MAITSIAHVISLFNYDPETGEIFSRRGRPIGSTDSEGYMRATLQKKPRLRFRSHRLAWLFMRGEWPADDIDHINGNRGDNRWVNLRCVSRATNAQNRRSPNRENTSGYLGVSFSKESGKWAAQIQAHGKSKNLGRRFATPEIAYEAYLAAKRQLHAGCTI